MPLPSEQHQNTTSEYTPCKIDTHRGMIKHMLGCLGKALMRLHHLWPRKSQNHTIPVNLEAIQTTMITSKLFQMLYLGYNWVLHYIVYGLQLSNFDISLAFTSDQHPWTYPLSSNISSRSQITCNRCNPVQKQPHMTSGFNCSMFLVFHWSPRMVWSSIAQDQYYLTQYFQDITVYFSHQFILTPTSAQSWDPEFYVP